ncbi:MAG: ribbon-helix-helix domain-containing protein [Candidatus Hodarchaeales archaeon]
MGPFSFFPFSIILHKIFLIFYIDSNPSSFLLRVSLIRTVTLYVEEKDINAMAELVRSGKYPNRSEFVRTAIRELIDEHRS